jgi:hypothetical protein
MFLVAAMSLSSHTMTHMSVANHGARYRHVRSVTILVPRLSRLELNL